MFSSSTVLVLVITAFLLLDTVTGQTVLQTGGKTFNKGTATALNKEFNMKLEPREWGRKLENLKKDHLLKNDHHGKILSNGDYSDLDGNVLGNLLDYNHN
jgi:hypothetical protein